MNAVDVCNVQKLNLQQIRHTATVDLMWSKDNLAWTNVHNPQNYVANNGEKTMTWSNQLSYILLRTGYQVQRGRRGGKR